MLRYHHHYHLRAFVKLILVGCLLREWIYGCGFFPIDKRFVHIIYNSYSKKVVKNLMMAAIGRNM